MKERIKVAVLLDGLVNRRTEKYTDLMEKGDLEQDTFLTDNQESRIFATGFQQEEQLAQMEMSPVVVVTIHKDSTL